MSNSSKIPCTIGILTLNSAEGLRACLESLSDFAEIIVCDGNSSDATVEIARAAGAKVIQQYASSEKDLPCVKDKAFARERCMNEGTQSWYFYMDADDTLSPEVIAEIRAIVTNPAPEYLIYRMPTRIYFEERSSQKEAGSTTQLREIKYEATYPSYQTRLVHRSVGAHFRGDVHDRLKFNADKFPVGTMIGYYNFHWPEKRIRNFWTYLGRYADWELETYRSTTFGNLLFWGIYRRVRTILGYIFWRLPAMYIRHGFVETMPVGIELTIVRYHLKLLFGTIAKYMKTRSWWTYIAETLRGKDLNRTLTNMALRHYEAMGTILDIGGGKGRASHYRFIRLPKWHKITSVDISAEAKPDIVLNIEEQKLPVADESFDYVFLFNVLEHINNRDKVLAEIRRVLKSVRSDSLQNEPRKGTLLGVIPFLVNVHPDPHDFVRLTKEGLEQLLKHIGFSDVEIKAVGKGPFSAGYYQFEYIVPRIVRVIIGPLVMLLDAIAQSFSRKNLAEQFPLSYIFSVAK